MKKSTVFLNPKGQPSFCVETAVFQSCENASKKLINLETGEVRDRGKKDGTWDRVMLKAGNQPP